jgi:hypothetical protein
MCEGEKLVTFYFWRQVGEATRDLFISWFPKWMEKPLKLITYTLLDDTILDAFGFEHPSPSSPSNNKLPSQSHQLNQGNSTF